MGNPADQEMYDFLISLDQISSILETKAKERNKDKDQDGLDKMFANTDRSYIVEDDDEG